jgi:hypothetical protein
LRYVLFIPGVFISTFIGAYSTAGTSFSLQKTSGNTLYPDTPAEGSGNRNKKSK